LKAQVPQIDVSYIDLALPGYVARTHHACNLYPLSVTPYLSPHIHITQLSPCVCLLDTYCVWSDLVSRGGYDIL